MKMKRGSILFFILAFIFLEMMIRVNSALPIPYPGMICTILVAVSAGLLLYLLSVKYAVALVLMEVAVIWYLIAFFTNDTYFVFMSPGIIGNAAGGVVTEFQSQFITAIKNGIWIILLYHVPVALLIIFRKKFTVRRKNSFKIAALIIALTVAIGGLGFVSNLRSDYLKLKMTNEYSYDVAVKNFGVAPALIIDIDKNLLQTNSDFSPQFSTAQENTENALASDVSEEPEEFEYNTMDIDFNALAEDETRSSAMKSIDTYVKSREPSKKNEYTGMFKGKNLVLICAESFTREVIDKERTPTLYRLATKGIVFEDYYQPFWGGSTSTGEYSFLMGIVPTDPNSMVMTIDHNLYMTMGNQLKRLGYSSFAFHNGGFEYYSRNLTHPNFGYDKYIAMGSGMEEGVYLQKYESDRQMFDFTIPKYIDQQPFSVYYMTISGHLNYDRFYGNAMCLQNWDKIDIEGASERVKAYYSCNQELEYSLKELLDELEEKGIMDDTVIVITGDHYPYGLSKSATWENYEDYLAELYGYEANTNQKRDHNAAIIWCGSLEKSEPIVVSEPTYSLDLVPTLSNLFGLEYDSRLLVGRDVLSDTPALVLWNDGSWLTSEGYYDGSTREFEPQKGVEQDDNYIVSICNQVTDMITFSDYVLKNDYYGSLFTN